MNKENRVSAKQEEKKKVPCEIHGSHEFIVKKDKDGEVYGVRVFSNKKTNKANLDKMLEACMNTPPITLKQIKEELKKEREEKKQGSENKQ